MKFKKIFASLALFASILTTSSCSLFGSDEGVMIERIESTSNSEGTTILTFYFTDEDQDPLVVEIPRGEQGIEGPIGLTGLGIEDITSRQSEDGKSTILTISFTSEDVPDKEIVVPNGVSVAEITSELDIENNTTIIHFTLSDGSVKDIIVPNGKDGIGIADVNQTSNDNGDIIVTITYTGEREPTIITLPYKNGEDGISIVGVMGTQIENAYIVTIYFSDGNSVTLDPIIIPEATEFLYGFGAPTSRDVERAKEGDFYFDTDGKIIYQFDGSSFNIIIDLTADNYPTATCNVTFDANGGYFVNDLPRNISVTMGRPIDASRIPICAREEMIFIGYYTAPEGPLNPLAGKLDVLTPIYSDVTFYACYE